MALVPPIPLPKQENNSNQQKEPIMDIQRIDELQELITHNLDGSGIRAQPKARVLELVERLASAYRRELEPKVGTFVAGDIGQRRITAEEAASRTAPTPTPAAE